MFLVSRENSGAVNSRIELIWTLDEVSDGQNT